MLIAPEIQAQMRAGRRSDAAVQRAISALIWGIIIAMCLHDKWRDIAALFGRG
jgi:hypothetical protein